MPRLPDELWRLICDASCGDAAWRRLHDGADGVCEAWALSLASRGFRRVLDARVEDVEVVAARVARSGAPARGWLARRFPRLKTLRLTAAPVSCAAAYQTPLLAAALGAAAHDVDLRLAAPSFRAAAVLGPFDDRLRELDCAGAPDVNGAAVRALFALCGRLEVLKLRRCEGLRCPDFFAAPDSLSRVELDGCWRLRLELLPALAALAEQCRFEVDLFEPLAVDGTVEVVILRGPHKGCWVACSVAAGPSRDWCYDVYVHETERYDRAIGFAGRLARGVSRAHLRTS